MAAAIAVGFAVTLSGTAEGQTVDIKTPIFSDARTAGSTWQYTTSDPGTTDWNTATFSDAAWQSGTGGFGTGTVQGGTIATDWSTPDIWIRKSFDLPDSLGQSLVFTLHHDDDVDVYLNGFQILQEAGFLSAYSENILTDDAKSHLLKTGNVLAIHCTNTGGAGYIDAGLSAVSTMNATPLITDARSAPTEWKYSITDPGDGWFNAGFDESSWTSGQGGFGSQEYAPYSTTPWTDTDIWIRHTVNLKAVNAQYSLSYLHDDAMEVYVNGTLALSDPAWTTTYVEQVLPALTGLLKVGDNVIAAHVHNDAGAQVLDIGLTGLDKPVPTGLKKGVKGGMAHATGLRLVGDRIELMGGNWGPHDRLRIYSVSGTLCADLRNSASVTSLAIPNRLGTGLFRYLWDSPTGVRQGKFFRMP